MILLFEKDALLSYILSKQLQIKVIAPIQVAVGDGFVDVVLLDGGGGFEVGDGAGDF